MRPVLTPVLAAVVLAAASVPPAAADIVLADFSDISDISLQASAQQAGNRLRVTDNNTGQVGTAWHIDPQFVEYGFETTFSFQLNERLSGGSDGFAFAIQSQSSSIVGSGSSDLGFTNIPGVVAVEFDTFRNNASNLPNYADPEGDHVAVMLGSNHATQQIGTPAANLAFGDAVHDVKIVYTPDAVSTPGVQGLPSTAPGTLEVFLDDFVTPIASVSINLSTIQGGNTPDALGRAFVGFTAGTGGGTQNHDILNWEFISTTPEPTAAGVLAVMVLGTAGRRKRLSR